MRVLPEIINGNTEDGVCLEVTRENSDDLLILYIGEKILACSVIGQEKTISFARPMESENESAVLNNWTERYNVSGLKQTNHRMMMNLEADLSDLNIYNAINSTKAS